MGLGDVKLILFLGLAFGWPLTLVNLQLAVFAGGAIAAVLLIFKKKYFGHKLAFGAFLSLAGLVTLFYGPILWFLYLDFLGI